MKTYSVKVAVRCRDDYRCVDCGMSDAEHRRLTKHTLHVHRLVPGSKYSVSGCVTLCRECHRLRHCHPPSGAVRLVLQVDEEVRAALKVEAARAGRDMSELGEDFLKERLADTLRELRERRAADKRKGGKA